MQPAEPAEVPEPEKEPVQNPDEIPEVPQLPQEDPDNIPGDDPSPSPPGEVPPPGETQ